MADEGEKGAAADTLASRARALKGQVGIAGAVARVDLVTSWLAAGKTPRQASTMARDEFSLTRRQADKYVAVALKRLADDNAAEPLESKRARVLAMAYDTIRQADERQKVVNLGRAADGEPMSEVIPDPDLRARTAALELIAKIEGVVKP